MLLVYAVLVAMHAQRTVVLLCAVAAVCVLSILINWNRVERLWAFFS